MTQDWWKGYFDAEYLREYEPLFDPIRDRREAARIIELLALPVGARILDCPCGQGRHAHLLAEAGYDVDGVDYSRELLASARKRGTARTLRYTRADMRRLPARWTTRFDAVINVFTSFGFFDNPLDDAQVIREFGRVLRPGGVLLWHGASRDGVAARFLTRDWWRTSDGTLVGQERSFDALSGVLSVQSEWQGRRRGGRRDHRIRLYTATRLAELCRDAGLVVELAYDGWSERPLRRASSEMLLIARKETELCSHPMASRPIRVLVAKPGLDGHDRGAKVVAAALRDAGMEVIYTGLHQTPEMIASAAVQEDVDVVGLSILSGAHMTLFPRVLEMLRDAGRDDILLTGGGIIPKDDMDALRKQGVGQLFGPGTPTSDLIDYINTWFGERQKQEA